MKKKKQSCGQKWCDRTFHHGINGSRKYNGNICFSIYKVSKSHTVTQCIFSSLAKSKIHLFSGTLRMSVTWCTIYFMCLSMKKTSRYLLYGAHWISFYSKFPMEFEETYLREICFSRYKLIFKFQLFLIQMLES